MLDRGDDGVMASTWKWNVNIRW